MDRTPARVRAISYVTRTIRGYDELLIFDYRDDPDAGPQLPGGGVEDGERPDDGAVRETLEETGVGGALMMRGVVGVHEGNYLATGIPFISVYFHLHTDDDRDSWTHVIVGDEHALDTGMTVNCRFRPFPEASELLQRSGSRQEEFIGRLNRARAASLSWEQRRRLND